MDSSNPAKTTAAAKDAQCERCGSFDAAEIGGQLLCAECVALAGCGCAGHGDEEG